MTEEEQKAKAIRDARVAAGFKLLRSLSRDTLLFGGVFIMAYGLGEIYSPLSWIFIGACGIGLAFLGTGGNKQ